MSARRWREARPSNSAPLPFGENFSRLVAALEIRRPRPGGSQHALPEFAKIGTRDWRVPCSAFALPPDLGARRLTAARCQLDRLEDLDVAGAAAEHAGER